MAGELVMEHYEQQVAVDRKADNSPVTVADREAEHLLRERILQQFPDDAILGEEHGVRAGQSGYRWILDPIDGTKSFIAGVPLFGTLVAVERGGRGVIGVIELPALRRRIFAERNGGAWSQDGDGPLQRAQVSSCAALADGLYLTSEISTFIERVPCQFINSWRPRLGTRGPGETVTVIIWWPPAALWQWLTRH